MTTSVLDRVPVDLIGEQARQVRPGRAVLTVIAAVLFGAGWVAAKGFGVAWLCAAWGVTAVRVGWKAGHGPSRADQIASLTAERARLADAVKRLGG